jgi:hypothetical protein
MTNHPLPLRLILSGLLGLALLAGSGCSGSTGVEVKGLVTRDGEPVDKGRIVFLPAQGTAGPAVGGTIDRGRYHISEREGLQEGKYVIEVKVGEVHRTPGTLRPTSRPELSRFDRDVSREAPQIDLELKPAGQTPAGG